MAFGGFVADKMGGFLQMTAGAKPICGIVSYNPNIDLLRRNIDAIRNQVSHVFVYDNGSTNLSNARKLVEEFGAMATLIDGGTNRGLAVALNALARRAIGDGARAIIFLDQDSVAPPDMVSDLSQYLVGDIGIVSPTWRDRNRAEEIDDDNEPRLVDSVITSGSLVSLDAYSAVGGYDERLFVDFVDYDFCIALRRAGYKILSLPFVVLEHSIGRAERMRIALPTRGAHGIYWKRYRYNHPFFRRFDMARSSCIILRKYKGTPFGHEVRVKLTRFDIMILISERNRWLTLKQFWNGWRAGRAILNDSRGFSY